MPYIRCPHCRARSYAPRTRATVPECPLCGGTLSADTRPADFAGADRPVPAGDAGVLEGTLSLARLELDMDVALLAEVEDGREVIRSTEGDAERFSLRENDSVPFVDTICREVLEGRIDHLVRDVRADPRTRDLPSVSDYNVGAYIGVPLTSRDARLYMLCCLAGEARPRLGPSDVLFLKGLAESVAGGLTAPGTTPSPMSRRTRPPVSKSPAAPPESYRATVDGALEGIITADLDGRIETVNPAGAALFGYGPGDLVGSPLTKLMPARDVPAHRRGLARFRTTGESKVLGRTTTHAGLRSDGTEFPLELSVTSWQHGGQRHFTGIVRDMSERDLRARELERRANHDPVTDLFNRARFEEEVELWMARTERHGSAGALVLLDLDGFKEVNDRLGHPSGDDVLRAVADGLRARLRAGDVAARIGGDEFAVLLTGVTIEEAVSVAEEFRDAVKAAASRPAERQLSGSVGVVLLEPGTSARQLLIEGDRALYEAKGAGRDRVVSVPARPDPRPRPEG